MKKLFLLLLLLPVLAWAGNYGSSIDGKDANVTFIHTSAIDSAHVVFGYPDTTNWYDSVFTYPVAWGSSKIMNGAGLDLDSIGVHVVKVRYYSGGAAVGHTGGVWLHEAGTIGTPDVNMAQISDDATAADNLETMLDGTGGQTLYLGRLVIHQPAGGSAGVGVVEIMATGQSDGLRIMAGPTSGEAIMLRTYDGDGIWIDASGTNKYEIVANEIHIPHILGRIDSATAVGVGGNGLNANGIADDAIDYAAFAATAPGAWWNEGKAGYTVTFLGDTLKLIVDDVLNLAGWNPSNGVLCWLKNDSLYTLMVDVDGVKTKTDQLSFTTRGLKVAVKELDEDSASLDLDGTSVNATCAASGLRTVVIQCLDYDDSTTGMYGVNIDVYDSAAGDFMEGGQTNTSGVDTFSLDDATYTVHLKRAGDVIDGGSPKYPIISSDSTLTYYVDQFDPGGAPSANQCKVWCLVSDLSTEWLGGCRMTLWVPSRYYPLTFSGTPVNPYTITATSNDTGYVYLEPYRTADLTAGSGETVQMYIELRAPNGDLIARVFDEIPDQASWEIDWTP